MLQRLMTGQYHPRTLSSRLVSSPPWSLHRTHPASPARQAHTRRHAATCSSADQLAGWVVANGGQVKGVAVGRQGQQGLGLIATQVLNCTTSIDSVDHRDTAACQKHQHNGSGGWCIGPAGGEQRRSRGETAEGLPAVIRRRQRPPAAGAD